MKTILGLLFIPLLWSCNATAKKEQKKKADSVSYLPTNSVQLTPQEKEHYHNLVSNFLDSTLLRQRFNGEILVAKNGEVIYEKYIGYKNLKTKDTLTPQTSFQIASTSKTLTSAATLQLIQEGKLKLDTKVSDIIPGFPFTDITVKNLLSQRSGLPEYLYFFEKGGWQRNKMATNNDVITALTTWELPRAFNPNRHFDYCNTNFVLLASIIEKVTGLPYPVYMRLHVFEPLGMSNTFVATAPDTANLTQSFDGFGKQWALDFSDGAYGDKNIYSTPRDLLKWDQALYSGKFIAQNLIDSAFTPYSNEKPSMHNYGLGWRMLLLPNGKKVIYHNGRWHGFNSAFARLVDEKVTIIILSNKFNKNVYFVARKMYDLFGKYDGKQEEGLE
ncbi:MAG: serine hydrolase domain-containing protein [Chitinophagaceae bacterium]